MTETQRQIIDAEERDRIQLKNSYGFTDADTAGLSAPGITVLYFMTCLAPASVFYGKAMGAFAWRDGRVFRFHYNIHTPRSKGPGLSNQMTEIKEVTTEEFYGETVVNHKHTDFGGRAFWIHTPMDMLNAEEKSLRAFMESLQRYCRAEELCKKLKKLDKANLAWEASRKKNM